VEPGQAESPDVRAKRPAFVPDLSDADLGIFICPGEPSDAAPNRPAVGSPEFVKLYRDLTPKMLKAEDLEAMSSTEIIVGPDSTDPRLEQIRFGGGEE
jgi:hypothetical protein